eukprot:6348779-Prorocentrum_lima.AAC.1
MTSSLVGSEMCIRDRSRSSPQPQLSTRRRPRWPSTTSRTVGSWCAGRTCLLYTSDAADDM